MLVVVVVVICKTSTEKSYLSKKLVFKQFYFQYLNGILKLQSYLTNNLDRNQIGFAPVMGTHANILLLVKKLRNS
jgi:hypothetical protein